MSPLVTDEQSNLDACYARAIELIWCDNPELTCGEVKAKLVAEFGQETVDATLAGKL